MLVRGSLLPDLSGASCAEGVHGCRVIDLQCEEVQGETDTAHKAPLVGSLISIGQAVPETLETMGST